MNIMSKKIFREIWLNKFRSLSIIAIVAITISMVSGMLAAEPMFYDTYALNQVVSNTADGRFTFTQPVVQTNVTVIKNNSTFMDENNIDRIEGRIIFNTELKFEEEKFSAIVIGIDYPNEVNQLTIEQRSESISSDSELLAGNDSCLIETHFAGSIPFLGQDIEIDDLVEVNIGGSWFSFNATGIAQDTDFVYCVDPTTNMPLLGELAIIWVNINTIQDILFYGQNVVNQVLYTVDERFEKEMILGAADSLTSYFSQNNIDVNTLKFELFDETLEYKMFESDAGAVDKFGIVFGLICIIVCAIIIINTLTKLVNSQRKNIGLFLSMGAKKGKILFHYINIALLLSFFGMLIGVPLGYGLSIGMTKMVTIFYCTPLQALSVDVVPYIITSAITLAICFGAALLSAWPITSVTPREAMSATFTRIKTTGKSITEKIFGWIPLFKPIHMLVPLREVFMNKKKTLITILALTTSMIVLVNSIALVWNMYDLMINNFQEYNTYDVQLKLETPVPIATVNAFMNNESNPSVGQITASETFVDLYTKINYQDEFVSWAQITCFQENSTMRHFNVIKGDVIDKSQLDESTILLGKAFASEYDISIGDEITIGLIGNQTVKVGGIVGELIDFTVFWTLESFYESEANLVFGLPEGFVNGISIQVESDIDLIALRNEFEEKFSINTWIESEVAMNSVLALMQSMLSIMIIFLVIGLIIGVVFSFQAMYMSFVDRQQDFLAFKAMGTKMKYLRRMIFWENSLLSIFGLILTVPLGYLSYIWSLDYMLEGSFYVPKTIPWFTWPIVLVLSLLALWLATARLVRRIEKLDLASELRQTGAT